MGEERFGRLLKPVRPFGIYRLLSRPSGIFLPVDVTVNLACPAKKCRFFSSLYVPETIEWE